MNEKEYTWEQLKLGFPYFMYNAGMLVNDVVIPVAEDCGLLFSHRKDDPLYRKYGVMKSKRILSYTYVSSQMVTGWYFTDYWMTTALFDIGLCDPSKVDDIKGIFLPDVDSVIEYADSPDNRFYRIRLANCGEIYSKSKEFRFTPYTHEKRFLCERDHLLIDDLDSYPARGE